MSTHNLSIQDALRNHRRNVRIEEAHAASLVKGPDVKIEPPYEVDEALFMTPYQQIYEQLNKLDQQALDLRSKYEEMLTSSDLTDYEIYCGECSSIGPVVRDSGGLCTECWIDYSILTDDPNTEQYVREFYCDEMLNEKNFEYFTERYVAYTRELNKRITKQVLEVQK